MVTARADTPAVRANERGSCGSSCDSARSLHGHFGTDSTPRIELNAPAACGCAPRAAVAFRVRATADVKQVALPHLPLDMLLTKRGAKK